MSRGRIEDHLDLGKKYLIKLDQGNLPINLAKWHFAKNRTEWLSHRITQSGIPPLSNKTGAIQNPSTPTILKKL